MKTINLTQGSPEWHAHRARHLNASDAPAMMGCSRYMARSELLRQMATGIVPDVDAVVQRRFDEGHRAEALARPLAEQIIGEELSPLVGVIDGGPYSASYDGLTLLEDVAFEHKSLNDVLRAAMTEGCAGADLPLDYQVQMEHQCMVCPTIERVLFMSSRWADDGTLLEERHCWYTPNIELRARIVAGWKQFAADAAAYVPEQPKSASVVAAQQESLPAVSVRVDGQLAIVSNLPAFGAALQSFIDRIPAEPSTDQEFADTEAACKALKRAEEALEAAENNALAQLADVDTMRRLVADYRGLARTTRLQREKLVALRKDQLRAEIVNSGKAAACAHTEALNKRLGGNYMPNLPADFAGAIKGKKSLDSMRDAVSDVLAQFKIAANEAADRIQANLGALRERQEMAFLFPDVLALVHKAPDDLRAVIMARIADHEAKESARLEAERERIRAEEQAKAEAAARAPVSAPQPVIKTLQPAVAKPVDDMPPLKLGDINARIAPLSVTAEGLRQLGFEPSGHDRRAVLYSSSDFEPICRALIEHLESVCEIATA